MEEKVTYIEISTKLDRIIQLLEGLTHVQPTPIYQGIEVEGNVRPEDFCNCGSRLPCPIHGGTITKCYDDGKY